MKDLNIQSKEPLKYLNKSSSLRSDEDKGITTLSIASEEDKGIIVSMLIKFKDESPYSKVSTNIDKINSIVSDALQGDKERQIIILGKYNNDIKGLIIGTINDLPFSDDKIASESIWYVEPEYRKTGIGYQLYEAFEYWATKLGIKVLHSAAPNDKLEEFYNKKEYIPLERVYIKYIGDKN